MTAIPTSYPLAPGAVSSRQLWAGRIAGGVAVLFLLMDLVMKLMRVPAAVAGTRELGWPVEVILPLGIIQLLFLIVYLIPRTAVLGAILWTGYLGGAVATHVRVGNPLFSHQLFPIYVALLLWGALWLRDSRLRSIVPLRGGRS